MAVHCQTGIRNAKMYYNKLKSHDSQNETVFDVYKETTNLIESKEFMLNNRNASRISKRDFSYKIRLPIFTKSLNINNNIVKTKNWWDGVRNTTESEDKLYGNQSNVIDFKFDLHHFGWFWWRVWHGEGCLQDAYAKKIGGVGSKLAREGKKAEMAIQVLSISDSKPSKEGMVMWNNRITMQFFNNSYNKVSYFPTINFNMQYSLYLRTQNFGFKWSGLK